LREIGAFAAGETVPYDDAADALARLNDWIDQQAAERLFIHRVTRTTWDLTANVSEYIIRYVEDFAKEVDDGFDTTWTGAPPGWTSVITGTGTVLNELSFVEAGGHAVNLSPGGAGTSAIYRDFVCFSGAASTLSIYNSASNALTAFVKVQCIETQHWLTSTGVWQAAAADAITAQTLAQYVQASVSFTTEAEAVVGSDICTLRVTLYDDTSGTSVYFDTFELTNAQNIIPIPRPDFINDVRLIDTAADPDYEIPMDRLTDDGWARVAMKALTSTRPSSWYYNPTVPGGTLSLWPVPTGASLKGAIYIPTQVARFASLDETIVLPPAYERAIVKNLALELCPSYNKMPHPLLEKQAANALAAVKRANKRTEYLAFEGSALIGNRRGVGSWDIRSGR
jgi:hypothetical protein